MAAQTRGRCRLCGKGFTRSGMARHLPACRGRNGPDAGPAGLVLQIADRHLSEYWLFLETSPAATWGDLDAFLRDIWVECCGHMSCFEYAGTTYVEDPREAREWTDRALPMSGRLARTVPPGSRFLYTYDFGTSTELVGRVLARVPATKGEPTVQVLARNDTPDHPCALCGQPATKVCGLCYQEADAACWYCEACAGRHRCSDPGADYFLPAVNSPRVGLCAYVGPAEG